MSRSPLDLLGVPPDAGEKEIKQAYASLLKQHRPDEDPDGFQRLNEAYQAAMACIRRVAGDPPPARTKPCSSDRGAERPADDETISPLENTRIELPTWRVAPDPFTPRVRISQTHGEADSTSPKQHQDTDPRFDHFAFSHALVARAMTTSPQDLRWSLTEQPDLMSIATKDATIPFVMDRLEYELPLETPQLEIILTFFGLHEVVGHPALQRRIDALRRRSRTAHPTWADLHFRDSASRRRSHNIGDFTVHFLLFLVGLIGLLRMCQGAG